MTASNNRSFDSYWERIDAATLRKIVKRYGGKPNLRKDECISFLRAAINDEERVLGVVQNLNTFEYNLLAFLKIMGGEAESSVLKAATYAADTRLRGKSPGYRDPFSDVMDPFLSSGLMLSRNEYGPPTSLSYGYTSEFALVFSDERILDQVKGPKFQSFTLNPTQVPSVLSSRPPHLITMMVISALNGIEVLQGLKLNLNQQVRATEFRKLAKTLDWKDNELVEGDFRLPKAAQFIVGALRACGLLSPQHEMLLPTALANEFINWPVQQQVQRLLQGIIRNRIWQETDKLDYGYYVNNCLQARFALYILLGCLSAVPNDLYRIDDLDTILFERIGEHFSITSYAPRFVSYGKDAKAVEKDYNHWVEKQRNSWIKNERLWLEEALKTWMYFLGLIRVDLRDGTPVAFGLTDLGISLLHPNKAKLITPGAALSATGQPAWIVQPNFDVVAYLDHLPGVQLAFLERNAERINTGEHVAQYRITRQSTHRGLENGMSAEDLINAWQSGSGKDLPQNIAIEIREWAALRDRITLYRRANLAEYPSAEARQAALKRGMTGKLIGERFLLITEPLTRAQVKAFYTSIDYDRPPARTLIIEEDGGILTEHETSDLLLSARLAEWAEIDATGSYRFSQQSIQRATQSGKTLSSLFKILEPRIARLVPPMMQIALHAWSGDAVDLSLENVLVLYSASPNVSYAIQNSAILRPYLRGVLAAGYFLVKREKAEALREQLSFFGIDANLIDWPPKD